MPAEKYNFPMTYLTLFFTKQSADESKEDQDYKLSMWEQAAGIKTYDTTYS